MSKEQSKKIALVLGGGSARGLAHIGVLKVLKRNKIPVDIVVGTSIGSLIGAIYALGISLKKVEDIAIKTRWWHLTDFAISKIGLIEGLNLQNMIKDVLEDKSFNDVKKPLYVVTTDIETGEEAVLSSGNLIKAIKASCSIPGIFIPTRIDGRLLVDGGLRSSVPTNVAKKMGADFIIAVDVGFCVKKGKITNIFQAVFQAMQIIGSELNKHEARHSNSLIEVHLSEDMDQMAFDKAKDIIAAGEKAAEEMMPALKTEMQEEGLLK